MSFVRVSALTLSVLVTALSASSISGCKSTKSKDNVAVPNELVDIQAKTNFVRAWSTSVEVDDSKHGEKLGPAVVSERVFVAGSDEIRALESTTGRVVWRKTVEGRLSGGPASDGKRVVVGGLDGEVIAFDANDGEELWRVRVSSEVLATPTFAKDIVVICSNDGRIYGLETSSGKQAWLMDRDVPLLSLRGSASALFDSGTVYIPSDSGKVVALDAKTGALIWEQSVNISNGRNEIERVADIDGGSVVSNGDLFVAGYNGQTSAVTASNGSTLWTYVGSSVVGLTADERNVYLTNAASEVIALDRRSGAELWKQSSLLNRYLTRPTVMGERLVVGDFEGYLHALSLENGEIIGRSRPAKQAFPTAVQTSGDLLIAQSASGAISAFRLQ
jgi:outer membrane protein assembly factor BamB